MEKKFIHFFIFISLGLFISILLTVYFVDPYQVFRKSWYKVDHGLQERYLVPGLARNYEPDVIILGTSMTQNFLPTYYEKITGLQGLKLSIAGSTLLEQVLVLEIALENKKLKQVIWGLDLNSKGNAVRDDFGPFPFYLYDKNMFNKYQYIMNTAVLEKTISQLKNIVKGGSYGFEEHNAKSLDKRSCWGPNKYTFDKDIICNNLKKVAVEYFSKKINKNKAYDELNEYESRRKEYVLFINTKIIQIIKEHPDVDFIIFFPPWSIMNSLQYFVKSETEKKHFYIFLEHKKHVVDILKDIQNVTIFDFQDAEEIVTNLDLYKDFVHYHPQVNNWMMDCFITKKHLIDKTNPYKSINHLKELVEDYSQDIDKKCCEGKI